MTNEICYLRANSHRFSIFTKIRSYILRATLYWMFLVLLLFCFFYFIDVTLYFRIQNAKSKPKTCAKTSIIFVIKEHSCNQKKLITVKNSNTLQFFKQLSFICFLLCRNLNFCIILLRDLVWLCLLFFGVASSYINPVEEIPNQILKTILFQLI